MTQAGLFYIGTSWKMHKTRAEAREWVRVVSAQPNPDSHRLKRFIIPPFTAIDVTRDGIAGTDFELGAQNVHHEAQGAFTGDVSVAMLADAGCQIIEIGHSERRAESGETDFLIAKKVRRVLDQGLQPLVCIGDSADERDAGAQIVSVLRQAIIALSLTDADERSRCLLAYEPFWAIGEGGVTAEPAEVGRVHEALKQTFPDTAMLYGGGVDTINAVPLAGVPGVDGLFIGRAALDPKGYMKIIDDVYASGAMTPSEIAT